MMTLDPGTPLTDSGAGRQLEGLTRLNTTMLTVYIDGLQTCMRATFDLQQEALRFLTRRVECDLAATQSLAKCRSWADVGKLQQDWTRAATEDYTAESSKVMEFAARTATEGFKTLREQAATTIRERNAA